MNSLTYLNNQLTYPSAEHSGTLLFGCSKINVVFSKYIKHLALQKSFLVFQGKIPERVKMGSEFLKLQVPGKCNSCASALRMGSSAQFAPTL